MQNLDLAQRIRDEHLTAGIREPCAHRGLERGIDQRRMQHELVETRAVQRRHLQCAQHLESDLRIATDFLQGLKGGPQAQAEILEQRISVFAVHDFVAASAYRRQIDVFVFRGFVLRRGVMQFSLAIQLFTPVFAFAEDLECDRITSGLQFDQHLVGCRVLHRQRTDPDDVPDLADLAPRGDLAGLARKVEIRDARKRRNVGDQMVVDEEFLVGKHLPEHLALECRLVAVDQWMQGAGGGARHKPLSNRIAIGGLKPMTFVGERIRRQRNASALPAGLHALPFGDKAIDPQLRKFLRIARLREQIDERVFFLATEHLGDALGILHVTDEDAFVVRAGQEALQLVDQPLMAVRQDSNAMVEGFSAELKRKCNFVEAGRRCVAAMLLHKRFEQRHHLPQLLFVARGQREDAQTALH